MSVSRCIGRALEIAKLPADKWAAEIDKLPTVCPHSDCGQPRNCRQRNDEYLTMQRRIARRQAMAGGRRD